MILEVPGDTERAPTCAAAHHVTGIPQAHHNFMLLLSQAYLRWTPHSAIVSIKDTEEVAVGPTFFFNIRMKLESLYILRHAFWPG